MLDSMADRITHHKQSDIQIHQELYLEAKFKGYKLQVVEGLQEDSYLPFYHQALGPNVCVDRDDSFLEPIGGQAISERAVKPIVLELLSPNNQLRGFVSLVLQKKEGVSEPSGSERTYNINFVAVAHSQQQKGLGSLLIKCACSVAALRGAKEIQLSAASGREGFYTKKVGMHTSGRDSCGRTVMAMKLETPTRHLDRVFNLLGVDSSVNNRLIRLPPSNLLSS